MGGNSKPRPTTPGVDTPVFRQQVAQRRKAAKLAKAARKKNRK